MELLVLGLLVGAGAAKRKEVTKALAKGYMAVAETSTHLREDMQAAIEEARVERDHESAHPDLSDSVSYDTSEDMLALQDEAASGHAAPARLKADEPAAEPNRMGKPKPSLNIFKSVAKSCLSVVEMGRSATAHVREDIRDAVEEARYEREQAASRRTTSVPNLAGASGGKKVGRPKGAASAKKVSPSTKQKAAAPAAKPQAKRAVTPKTKATPTAARTSAKARPSKATAAAKPAAETVTVEAAQVAPAADSAQS